jgi:hypothetical protein
VYPVYMRCPILYASYREGWEGIATPPCQATHCVHAAYLTGRGACVCQGGEPACMYCAGTHQSDLHAASEPARPSL